MRWLNETAPTCESCRKTHGNMVPPKETPCDTCRPQVMPENRDAVDVYLIARNQVLTVGMGEVADISFPAVKIVMDMLEVKNQKDCFFKVRGLFHEFRPKGENK